MADALTLLWQVVPPVLLVVGVLLTAQRWMRRDGSTGTALRVVARTGMTRSSVVAVVAVGTRRFLVGASEAGVRLLTELDPERSPEHDASVPATVRTTPRGSDPAPARPRTGLVDRLRDRTVRVPVSRTGHVVQR